MFLTQPHQINQYDTPLRVMVSHADQASLPILPVRVVGVAPREISVPQAVIYKVVDREGTPFLVKQMAGPNRQAAFAEFLPAQRAVSQARGTAPRGRVAQLLASDAEATSLVYEFIDGTMVADDIGRPDLHRPLALQTAAWLGHFSRPADFTNIEQSNERGTMIAWADIRRAQIAEQGHRVIEPQRFDAALAQFRAGLVKARQVRSPMGLNHGDMNFANMLQTRSGIVGVDIVHYRVLPVGYDLGDLLTRCIFRLPMETPVENFREASILRDVANAFEDAAQTAIDPLSMDAFFLQNALRSWFWYYPLGMPEERGERRRAMNLIETTQACVARFGSEASAQPGASYRDLRARIAAVIVPSSR